MPIEPRIYADYASMCEAVADQLLSVVRTNPLATIGLSTGATPIGIYAEIVRRQRDDPTDFSQACFFQLDEYIGLPPEHPQSYHRTLWDTVLTPIGAAPSNVHIPEGSAADPAKACEDYEQALAVFGPVDLWIIGLGSNGHIAFNEPGSALDSTTRVVALSEQTRANNARYFTRDTPLPTHAITAGLGTIQRYAKHVAFIVSGAHKQQVLADVLATTEATPRLPASVLHGLHTAGYFDADAAFSRA